MKTKKYLCVGGFIHSRHDGDRHYISARQLVRLYDVSYLECILYDSDKVPFDQVMQAIRIYTERFPDIQILGPKYYGDYNNKDQENVL